MITNTYQLIRQPTAREILDDFSASYWLQNQVTNLIVNGERDMLDALRDIEVLHAIVKKRFEDLTV